MNKYLLIFLMLIGSNALAAVSKWVDSDGHTHYSDQPPPPGEKAARLHSISGDEGIEGASGVPVASAPAAPKTIAEREADLKKAQKAQKEAADKAARQHAAEDAKKANCVTSQQNLRTLQEGMRMVEVDAKGERSIVSDEQRQKSIAKTQQDISTFCK